MGLVGVALARELAGNAVIVASLVVTAALTTTTVLMIFSARVGAWCAAAARVTPVAPVRRMGTDIVGSVQRYARYHGELLNVLAASVGVQILRIVQAYCLGRSLGIGADIAVYFAFIPVILLIMLLPVSVNGLGTSQAAFVWFFARVGVEAAPAFALSILFVALGIVGNLPGGLLYAMKGLAPVRGSAR